MRAYDPLETILPQTWFPYLAADRAGTVVGATVAGSDMVGRHAWLVSAGAGLESDASRRPGIGYGYGGLFPRLELGLGTSYRSVPGFAMGTTERATGASASLTFPWGSTRRATLVHGRVPGEPPTIRSRSNPANAPEAGLASELQFTFGFGSTERPAEAISPEDGVGLQVGTRFGAQAVGSDFSYAALDVSGGGYLRLPWAKHHVLALLGRVGARFPKMRVRFVHSGWGGDRVTGGGGGPIDLRLRRDVIAYRPTVMTIMLGMNDGRYRAFDPEVFREFSTGYESIVQKMKAAEPNLRITVIQPSPFDDVTRPHLRGRLQCRAPPI